MKFRPAVAGSILAALTLLGSCQVSFMLPWEKKAEDDRDTLVALLFLLSAGNPFGSSSSDCTNSSGMVICVPSGLAE